MFTAPVVDAYLFGTPVVERYSCPRDQAFRVQGFLILHPYDLWRIADQMNPTAVLTRIVDDMLARAKWPVVDSPHD